MTLTTDHPGIPLFAIPLFPNRTACEVIPMPAHHRNRKYARRELDPRVIHVAPHRHGSYSAAKQHVIRRCTALHLQQWQLDACVGRVTALAKEGKSCAAAIEDAMRLARNYRDQNNGRSPSGDAA
jgi:hypothetical protein